MRNAQLLKWCSVKPNRRCFGCFHSIAAVNDAVFNKQQRKNTTIFVAHRSKKWKNTVFEQQDKRWMPCAINWLVIHASTHCVMRTIPGAINHSNANDLPGFAVSLLKRMTNKQWIWHSFTWNVHLIYFQCIQSPKGYKCIAVKSHQIRFRIEIPLKWKWIEWKCSIWCKWDWVKLRRH